MSVIMLLVKLRLISKGTMDLFATTDAGAHLASVLSTISEFVRGDDVFQRQQRDHIGWLLESPFVTLVASKLRDCSFLSLDVHEDDRHRDCLPDEFLHLLQDCYTLSPGVGDLLDELLPDERREELIPLCIFFLPEEYQHTWLHYRQSSMTRCESL